jgi:hypothetical protein
MIKKIINSLFASPKPISEKKEFTPCINGDADTDIEAISAKIDRLLTDMLFRVSQAGLRPATRKDAQDILLKIADDLKNNTRKSVLTQEIIDFFDLGSKGELKHPYQKDNNGSGLPWT